MYLGARSRENEEGQQLELEEFENIPLPSDRLVHAPFSPVLFVLGTGLMRVLRVCWPFTKCPHLSAPGQDNGLDKQ